MNQHTLTKRICRFSFITAGLALLFGPTAFAQQCPQPSPQQCMDPQWAETECGQQQKALADVDPNEICNTYVKEAIVSHINQTWQQEAYTQDYTVVPDGMFGAGEVRPTLIAPERWAETVDYYGYPSTYSDHLMRQKVAALNPQSWAAYELMSYAAPWAQNGNAVWSCNEYVYEKWFDYSRYVDDAAALKSNYRAIFDRARRWPDGLNWGPVKSKDGTPQREVRWPSGKIPKNAFFLFQPTPYDDFVFDPTTIPHPAGEEYWNVDWGYHGIVDGAMAMAGKTDAEMYAMDVKQEKFKKLLARRAKLIAELEKEATGTFSMFTVSPFAFTAPVTELFTTKTDFYAIKDPGEIGTYTGGGSMATSLPPFTGGYTGKRGDLYAVDFAISNMLIEARDKGCLDLFSNSVCDWSPKQFVNYLDKQFVADMESDYNRCIAATGDDFSPSSIIRGALSHGISGAWKEDYTGSSTDVTRFLDLYEAYVVSKDFTPSPGTVDDGAVGWWKFGGNSAGSPDLLQGNYNWAVGFGLRKGSSSPTPDCSAELSALAQFNAGVVVNNTPYNVIDFLTSVETQNDKLHAVSHLTIAGYNLYTPINSDVGLSFTILDVSDTKELTAKGNMMVGPIPVTYKLGVVGEGGLNVGFGATLGRVCADGGGDVNLVLDGHATARIAAGVLASGGVGVSGVSVGISGTLNLVDVSFKPTAAMTIHNATPGDLNSLVADFTFDMPRRFATLSGTIKFYVDLTIWSYKAILAKWDGIVTEVNDAPPRPIRIPLHKVWWKI
jgi:hypothetical protein